MSALDIQISGTHYKDMPIQPIEFITKNKLDWYQGNIIKYASRHHNKGGADDLRKVIHYAELALEAQYGAAVESTGQEPTAEAGWIKWGGGKRPVAADVFVRYVCINGHNGSDFAGALVWCSSGEPSDIFKYRVAE
jgi:hypothetical protein